jgi:hypothetical protein
LGTGINDAIDASGITQHTNEGTETALLYLNSPHIVIHLGRTKNEVLSGVNNSDQAVGTVFGFRRRWLAPGTYNHASTLLAVNNSGNAVGNIQDASGETPLTC